MMSSHPVHPPSRCAVLLLALAIWLLASSVPGVAQEDWKRGQVRDLAFEVPASWHFIFDEKEKVGGYTPDARKSLDLPMGIAVLPGKASEAIPKKAIERTEILDLDGHLTRRYHVKMPAGAQMRTIMVDLDRPGKRIALGGLSAEVPQSWRETESRRGPLSARYAISPRHAGLAGLVTIDLAGRDGAAAFSDYVEEAGKTLLQDGRRLESGEVATPWESLARLEGVMVWGPDGAQPTVMEIRSAGREAKLHILTIVWPANAEAGDIETARRIADSGSLGPVDTVSQAQAEEAPEQLLFDGTLGERWQPLAVTGGNFEAFARIENGTLVVDVPEGNVWGKTGIWTSQRLVKVPSRGESAETVLTFAFDPERSSDVVVALGQQDNADEWGAHDVRVGWNRDAGGKSSTLTMWVRRGEVMKTKLGAAAMPNLTLRLQPGGLVVAEAGSGSHVEGVLPADVPTDGFGVYVLAHAPAAGQPAKMALRSVSLAQRPLGATPTSGDPSLYSQEPQDIALFDGTLGTRWVRHNAHGGNFETHAQLKDGELVVDVPAESSWGKVGIFSPEPLVWLDRFGEGGSATLTYRFDPDRTTGFVAALAMPGWGGVGGNDPGTPALLLHWRRMAEGSGAKATLNIWPQYKEPVWEVDVPGAAPELVKIVLSPAGVRIEGRGLPEETAPWDVLAEGQGLRVWAYSHPDAANQPVKMALKEIHLERTPGAPVESAPATGVKPLPMKVLFDGAANEIWEPAAANGGDFQQFAHYENKALVVDVPKGHGWAWTGLLSVNPVLTLDERVWKSATRFTFRLDPRRSDGLRIATAGYKAAEMWANGHSAWITFAKDPSNGSYLLGLHNSAYSDWSRRVDARWVETVWDGALTVDFGHQWIAVCLADGPCVRGTSPLGLHTAQYMTVLASAWESGGPARMALKRIERSIVAPPGMTAQQRFGLLDDADFNPEEFLRELAKDLAQ